MKRQSGQFDMRSGICIPVLTLIFCILGVFHSVAQVGELEFPKGSVQHVVLADEIQWNPCPPNLPEGCEIAVLEGDPKSSGLFTVRFKVKKGFMMPSHTHPENERVTVISGRVSVGFGAKAKQQEARHFEAGDYYVNASNAVHKVWADSDCILQITGIGPWKADFIAE